MAILEVFIAFFPPANAVLRDGEFNSYERGQDLGF
jgi:hypothetical protein